MVTGKQPIDIGNQLNLLLGIYQNTHLTKNNPKWIENYVILIFLLGFITIVQYAKQLLQMIDGEVVYCVNTVTSLHAAIVSIQVQCL